MERTISIKEERMYPPVLTIINPLHTRFPAYHWRFILFPDYGKPTSNTTLQMVSIGITTKETMASAIVRWKTKKWTLVRLRTSYLGLSQVTFKTSKLKNGKSYFADAEASTTYTALHLELHNVGIFWFNFLKCLSSPNRLSPSYYKHNTVQEYANCNIK